MPVEKCVICGWEKSGLLSIDLPHVPYYFENLCPKCWTWATIKFMEAK
jgi:hypothetical protein